ncbi:DsbA family protein [Actinomycetaceae bacterium L2_0104]
MSATVDFWFDASCPWTWITSRWIVEVAQERDLDVVWHPFSLAVLNEGKDIPEDYRKHVEDARLGARVAAAVSAECGNEVLGTFYTELGNRHFVDGRQNERGAIDEALAAAGAPAELIERAADYADAIAESTREGLRLVGDDVGVPIVAFDGVAFFGPVISPAPHGQAALDLWDGCLALARTPGFFELKRSRDVDPIFD